MPLKIEAILSNTQDRTDSNDNAFVSPTDFWAVVSGVTPGAQLSGAVSGNTILYYNIGAVTVPHGFAIGSTTSRALVPIVFKDPIDSPQWYLTGRNAVATTAGIVISDMNTNETTVVTGPLFVTTVPSVWTISQDSSKNCNITCTSMGSGGKTPFLISLNRLTENNQRVNQGIPGVFEVDVFSPAGENIFSSPVSFPGDGSLPFIQIPSASITTSGKYAVQIKTRYSEPEKLDGNAIDSLMTLYKYQNYPAILTAPSASPSAPSSMYSWLNSDYWYLTDLQLNVATRNVTSRLGSISVRPNDTVQFAVLFNNGTEGVDPIATDVKIAVRKSTNNGPYVLWSAATVTTTAVGSDIYYAITVTASDEDLLSGQSAQLFGVANPDQALIGQIQWTTTRGTFSSNSFTITAKNEVAREPDI